MRRKLLYALIALAATAAVTGPAIATAAHSDAAKKHKTSTKTGPRGPQGPRGPAGHNGKAGATGPAGANGTNGSLGTVGSAGSNGAAGNNGAAGSNGAAGASGVSYLRTVLVSPTANTQAGNGALLVAAITGLTGVNAGNPVLVLVEPGFYDIGSTALSLPSHVDLQGSGEDTTTILGEGSLVLTTAASTQVRYLTVSDTNVAGSATAISTGGGLLDVTANASGTGAATAVLANAPSTPIVNVTASATTSALLSSATAIHTVNTVFVRGGTFTALDGAATGQAAALFAENATSVNGATLQASGGSGAYPAFLGGTSQVVKIISSTLSGSGGLFVPTSDTLDIGGSEIPGVITGVTGAAHCPNDWLATYSTTSTNCN